eukprot:6176689-Pyramimonas_sp.AAC.1
MEHSDVVRQRKGQMTHFGRLFAILVEKNSEHPIGHKYRMYIGRVVFDGSYVGDQDREVALSQELSSSPATMQASKAADTSGLFDGRDIQPADAKQACTQSKLGELQHEFPSQGMNGRPLGETCGILCAL